MKGYKGFSKGLVCRKKQYAENTTFEENEAEICHSGMHFCDNPISVLSCYPPKDGNEYAEVESLSPESTDDKKKYCTTKLKIGVKISLPTLIKSAVSFVWSKIDKIDTKEYSSGDYSTSATSGDYSTSATSGNSSTSATSGDYSTSATSGNSSTSATSGYYSTAKAIGKNSIAVANGVGSKGMGAIGCYIVLSEYNEQGELHAVMKKVDGKKIKPDTIYTLKNGKFVEA